jgi:hypothetical protein
MLGFAWITTKQAQDALKNGRLDEAYRLLSRPEVQGHKGAYELQEKLARGFLERGAKHLRQDNLTAAWNDLVFAEQAGANGDELRRELVKRGQGDARAFLEAGEPGRAVESLKLLLERGVRNADLQLLEEAARGWSSARDLADRGDFAQALQAMTRVRGLMPDPPAALRRFHDEVDKRQQQFVSLLVDLHAAVDAKQWRRVLQLADLILALAPQHIEARKAKARAWKLLEPSTIACPPPALPSTAEEIRPGERSPRVMLWIDGVGGYLVCLGSRLTFGQAIPDAAVDVPIQADVSRQHAVLTRDPEGYLLEALRPVQVNAQPIHKTTLRSGDRVTLGTSCQFQFHVPSPVSTTARLDLVSGHRLPLAVSQVFVMSDTLVIGPGPQAHLSVPDLLKPIVLFRHKDGLGVRYGGPLVVDGEIKNERALVGMRGNVTGEDFTFALEPFGLCLGRA